jgi:AMMECR1 domain-containing protein
LDWEVGRHGIVIDATFKGKYYSATFLPEVAAEEKWSKEETLKQLIRKAGFRGKL